MARKAKRKSAPRRPQASSHAGKRWSRGVTEHSDALTLDRGVFTLGAQEDRGVVETFGDAKQTA